MAVYRFKHPQNEWVEEFDSTSAFIVTLLLGPLYFCIKEVWNHALASVIIALCTGFISWLVYPFFTRKILIKHYLKQGYKQVE